MEVEGQEEETRKREEEERAKEKKTMSETDVMRMRQGCDRDSTSLRQWRKKWRGKKGGGRVVKSGRERWRAHPATTTLSVPGERSSTTLQHLLLVCDNLPISPPPSRGLRLSL